MAPRNRELFPNATRSTVFMKQLYKDNREKCPAWATAFYTERVGTSGKSKKTAAQSQAAVVALIEQPFGLSADGASGTVVAMIRLLSGEPLDSKRN
jgi:hypothetical protein